MYISARITHVQIVDKITYWLISEISVFTRFYPPQSRLRPVLGEFASVVLNSLHFISIAGRAHKNTDKILRHIKNVKMYI